MEVLVIANDLNTYCYISWYVICYFSSITYFAFRENSLAIYKITIKPNEFQITMSLCIYITIFYHRWKGWMGLFTPKITCLGRLKSKPVSIIYVTAYLRIFIVKISHLFSDIYFLWCNLYECNTIIISRLLERDHILFVTIPMNKLRYNQFEKGYSVRVSFFILAVE